MSYATIQSLLDAKLQTVSDLPDLQLENTRNLATVGSPFMRATLLPARSRQLTIGADGKDEHQGIYQVDLFVPLDGGTSNINAMVDRVIAAFPRSLQLTGDGVTVKVSLAQREVGQRVQSFYMVPVSIRWAAAV